MKTVSPTMIRGPDDVARAHRLRFGVPVPNTAHYFFVEMPARAVYNPVQSHQTFNEGRIMKGRNVTIVACGLAGSFLLGWWLNGPADRSEAAGKTTGGPPAVKGWT